MPNEKITYAEARGRLIQIAARLMQPKPLTMAQRIKLAEELREAEQRIARRKARKKAPSRSRPVTDELEAKVKTLRQQFPKWPLQKLAETVGTNAGRVSEILHGKR